MKKFALIIAVVAAVVSGLSVAGAAVKNGKHMNSATARHLAAIGE